MKVYQLRPDVSEIYREFTTIDEAGKLARREGFNGQKMRATWQPIEITAHKDAKSRYDGNKFPAPNFSQVSSMMIFDNRAVVALADILEANGELLPLVYEGKDDLQYVAFNTTTVIDALDEANSEVERFRNGKIMVIDKYEFDAEKLKGATIFRIPQQLRVYVTDEFMRRVEEAGLTGFGCVPLWNDENINVISD